MDLFSFKAEDKVLLVGEGNFTFSCELVRILKKEGIQNLKSFYPTCFEIEEKSAISEENRSFLESQVWWTVPGVRVYYGVDATKLSEFHHGQFTKIIFNFPHVGGKMKINLNRSLLKEFFLSAADVLLEGGVVLMSLCAGQGGTGAEVKQRRWDDTWQVAEMAAHGEFILKKVTNFPHEIFPKYISTGYRSQEKSFHTNGSLVHVFQKSDLHFPSELHSPNDLFTFQDIQLFFEHKNAMDNNPFEKTNSPQSYLLSLIKNFCNLKIKSDLPLCVNISENRAPCFLNMKKMYLRKSLFEVLTSKDDMIAFGLVFNEISSMSEPVAFCELLIQTSDVNKIEEINKKFNINMKKHSQTCHSMNVDEVCATLFNTDVKQLWTGTCLGFEFIPNIVFPKEYEFHVSFGSDLSFDEKSLCVILSRLPGGIISSVRQKSVYHPKDLPMTYYCYRITYISYKYPLYRSRVVMFHKNILCRVLEKFYKVNIR